MGVIITGVVGGGGLPIPEHKHNYVPPNYPLFYDFLTFVRVIKLHYLSPNNGTFCSLRVQ